MVRKQFPPDALLVATYAARAKDARSFSAPIGYPRMVCEITVSPRPASPVSTADVETCHPLFSYLSRIAGLHTKSQYLGDFGGKVDSHQEVTVAEIFNLQIDPTQFADLAGACEQRCPVLPQHRTQPVVA
jgi:hypothetical protein